MCLSEHITCAFEPSPIPETSPHSPYLLFGRSRIGLILMQFKS
jgi:hypothetical protein